ncbi:flagellar hook-basal body protein [Bacillus cereus]|uniref:Flagellar basal-body rod protein FlgG n=1 Tax=Bacillus cereus TaxID=1396 RepID=A0A162PHY6_BACCE|nr:flagellar hook-basal body protein [Bacillus cereus]KZD72065.1 Flagellar basal-body rod protein FlgG [Bacillus cereus]HDR8321088.1 flagellar hook-basal body protein [Bacillus cereus]HDR8327259.1 flagellar hook-basal body protein [Bacillus cereus]HDR8333025.1 flagellar hook-basal body protein [Bacillus cereus]
MSGIYVGAMGMISNGLKLDAISNNISNSLTTGYKRDEPTFKLFQNTQQVRFDENGRSAIGKYEDMVYADHIETNFQAGSFMQSKETTDLALMDEGNQSQVSFFTVMQNGEERLTRNGAFKIDSNGTLHTNTGATVLDTQNKPVVIPKGTKVSFTDDGRVQDASTGNVIANLKVVSVDKSDVGLLQKGENATFKVMNREDIMREFGSLDAVLGQFDQNPTIRSVFGSKERINEMRNGNFEITQPFGGKVKQYFLESSNVDYVKEMTELLNAQKSLQAAQKVLKTSDEILTKETEGFRQ